MARTLSLLGLLLAGLIAGVLALAGHDTKIVFATFIVLATVTLFATNSPPPHITSVMLLAILVIVPWIGPEVAFAGFSTSAFWLVFGGLVMGSAIVKTGLGARLAGKMVGLLPDHYFKLVSLIVLMGLALGFLVPSAMARVVILLPVVALIAERLDFADERAVTGLQLAAILGTTLPAFTILTGNLPTILVFGAAERLYGFTPSYLSYLLAQFVPIAIGQTVLIILVAYGLFSSAYGKRPVSSEATAMSPIEKRVAIVIVTALLLWMADRWHGIAPGWVALLAAALLLLPAFEIFARDDFKRAIEHEALMYTAGIIALVALVAQSGLSGVLATLAEPWLASGQLSAFGFYINMALASIGIGVVATHPTVAATLVPLAELSTAAAGLPLEAALLAMTGPFAVVFLPYQVAPIAVGLAIARASLAQCTLMLVAVAVPTMLILLPLHYLWLNLLGWLG